MNERTFAQRSERGQALVLIVIAIVAVFALVALSIDIGQIYYARRSAQAAADSAAMAAAYRDAGESKNASVAIAVAFDKAKQNGYDNNGVTNWVFVNNPPVGGSYCGICGNPAAKEYYQVKITVKTNPIFAQLFFKGVEQTTVEATSHARKPGPFTGYDALVALDGADDAFLMDGKVSIELNGGNMRSFGGMVKNGASGTINVHSPGKVYYATTFGGFTSPFTDAKPQKNPTEPLNPVPEPYCPSQSEGNTWPKVGGIYTKTIDKVNYYYYPSGLNVSNLAPGIHCVYGGIDKGDYAGSGILVVLMSGDIKLTGNDSVDFRSSSKMVDKNGNQFGGMVLYVRPPDSGTQTITFGGNSKTFFHGTIYAPGADCDLGGTSDGRAENAAFVCNTFKFHGNPDYRFDFKPSQLYQTKGSVSLVE